jgi:hypothetical protein
MAPNSKNDDDYQFARAKSTWKPNFAQIGGFLYFGDHFGFKMAAIANQDGRHMVQHVLLPVNIHFHEPLMILQIISFLVIIIIIIPLLLLRMNFSDQILRD